MSDRVDRRLVILGVAALGGAGSLIGIFYDSFTGILIAGAIIGGTSNPLYALLIAYANDYLEKEDMAAASGGLLFVNGCGAVLGPLFLGWAMDRIGPWGYWAFLAALMFCIAGYAGFRMTQRSRPANDIDNVPYAPLAPSSTAIFAEAAQEVYIDAEESEEQAETQP